MRIEVALLLCMVLACPVLAQNWCGIQTLYFQHNASTTPAGYEELINFPSGNPEVIENVSITSASGPTLIDAYIGPEGSLMGTSELLRGLRRYRTYQYVSSASGTTQLNFTGFRRFANGTEQVLYSALTTDINDLVVTEIDTNIVMQNPVVLNPTDRIGVKVYAQTTQPSSIIVYWVYQGTTHTSHFESGYYACPATVFGVSGGGGGVVNPGMPIPVPVILAAIGLASGLAIIRKRE